MKKIEYKDPYFWEDMTQKEKDQLLLELLQWQNEMVEREQITEEHQQALDRGDWS